MPALTPEIQSLWVHLLSEHEDIQILREKLAKAQRRHQQLADEIHQKIEALRVAA